MFSNGRYLWEPINAYNPELCCASHSEHLTTANCYLAWEIGMKIKFEFESSYKGTLTIDGKEFEIIKRPGQVELKAPEGENLDETLGGIIADELFGKFADVMQAWAIADEIDCNIDSWSKMSVGAADAAYRAL